MVITKNGNVKDKISDDDSDSDFCPSKISNVTNDLTIDRNDDNIEDITASLINLSVQSCDDLDITGHIQSSDKTDNPTVKRNILPIVKGKF